MQLSQEKLNPSKVKELDKIAKENHLYDYFWQEIDFHNAMNNLPMQLAIYLHFKTENAIQEKNKIFLTIPPISIGTKQRGYDRVGKLEKILIFEGEFNKKIILKKDLLEKIKSLELKQEDLWGFIFQITINTTGLEQKMILAEDLFSFFLKKVLKI